VRLLIGVSGGIAAYKALETARLAVKAGHSVRVIQTPTSERFVGRASFAGITGAPVLTDEFEQDPARGSYPGDPLPERTPISHLALVERADVFLIAPASANTLAKLASGAADNLVTTAALAAACPVAVAPAMNNSMYLNAATQANLRLLEQRGLTVIPPGEGELASHGERGIGRLAEPAQLLAACEALVRDPDPRGSQPPTTGNSASNQGHRAPGDAATVDAVALRAGSLQGVHVLVTAGGTQEPIDSVRYIGNRSSGRMGYALAEVAAGLGASVTVVAANVKLDAPAGAEVIAVRTAAQLACACRERFGDTDVLLMAAAVADFRPVAPAAHKLKKTGPDAPLRIELEPTEDVLCALAAERHDGQVLVGFAAEHGERALDYGREKLARKGLDVIVVNDISRPEIGFDSVENEVVILGRDGSQRSIAQSSKNYVARAILEHVVSLINGRLTTQPSVVK
jgi:phosphopantothenoylcysteine decarboxylase/phosphopantothenate--cysteine ligase